MNKIIIIILGVAFCSMPLSAQNFFKHKTYFLNAGSGISNIGIPIYLGGEYGIKNSSYGCEVMFCPELYPDKFYDDLSARSPNLTFTFAYSYHMLRNEKSNKNTKDFYVGITANFFLFQQLNQNDYFFNFGPHFGYRHYFSNNLGMNIEFGLHGLHAVSKVGISYLLSNK